MTRNNCFIDTLRQQIPGLTADINAVRDMLHDHFPHGRDVVRNGHRPNFLNLQAHWSAVIECLGHCALPGPMVLHPANFRIICVDLDSPLDMSTFAGIGSTTLYIAREGGRHFVPLFPTTGEPEDEATAFHPLCRVDVGDESKDEDADVPLRGCWRSYRCGSDIRR